tara:strand:+ start:1320 stop:3332 length:2013 start_codon:yes stop_codon:yes gene_type:complete
MSTTNTRKKEPSDKALVSTSKRPKTDTTTPTDPFADESSDDDSDHDGGSKLAPIDKAKRAKEAFLASCNAARERAKDKNHKTQVVRSGSDHPHIAVNGIIINKQTKTNPNKTQRVEYTIWVTEVKNTSGALDAIDTGVAGFVYLLPTKKYKKEIGDNTATESKDNTKSVYKPRELKLIDVHHKAILVGTSLRLSMFKHPTQQSSNKGNENVEVGMLVAIHGMVASLDDNNTQVWLNTNAIVPIGAGHASDANVTSPLFDALTTSNQRELAAMLWSQTMAGFFDYPETELTNEHQERATEKFRSRWEALKQGAANACIVRANELAQQVTDENGTTATHNAILRNHAERLTAESSSSYAFNMPLFSPCILPSAEYPLYKAILVHKPCSPSLLVHEDVLDLYDGGQNAPETFVAPQVLEPPTIEGMLVSFVLHLTFVASKTDAISAIRDSSACVNAEPFIRTTKAAVGLKTSLRTMATVAGIVFKDKMAGFAKDMLMYGHWISIAGVVPRKSIEDHLNTNFPDVLMWDMPKTLSRMCILVSKDWVKQSLAEGNSQYGYEKNATVDVLKKSNAEDAEDLTHEVSLGEKGYQEITGSFFKFDSARTPPGKPNKEYRVWWPEVIQSISDNPELVSDASAGENAVKRAYEDARKQVESLTMVEFLVNKCAIYAIATE